MSSTAVFRVKYDGPALASHEMDVKDLAPALLSIGELLEEANVTLNGGQTSIKISIKAPEAGSIDVVLITTVHNIVQSAVSLFNSDGVNAVLNAQQILALIGFGSGAGGGVLKIIKWLKNRPIHNVVALEDGNFRLELIGGEAKVVKKTEIELFRSLKIRKYLETIIRTPLLREGVDSVSFSEDGSPTKIEKGEGEYFEAPPVSEEMIDEIEIEQSLQIINISFQDGGKWRFSDGNATFYAEILDQGFIQKVQRNQAAFAKDDILRVRLKRKQAIVSGGIRTDYTILQILEHRSAALTIALPFSKEE